MVVGGDGSSGCVCVDHVHIIYITHPVVWLWEVTVVVVVYVLIDIRSLVVIFYPYEPWVYHF